MTRTGLEHLETWQKAKDLAVRVYLEIVPLLPLEEKYNLISQIKRAAASIPANIAEGYGRFYYQTNVQFCYIARGSLEELISHPYLASELKYIHVEIANSVMADAERLSQLINGYIAYLKRTKQGEKELQGQLAIKENRESYALSVDASVTDFGFYGSRFSDNELRSSDIESHVSDIPSLSTEE